MSDKHTYTITIIKTETETFQMDLEDDDIMSALDQARAMTQLRNNKPNVKYNVSKIDTKDKQHG